MSRSSAQRHLNHQRGTQDAYGERPVAKQALRTHSRPLVLSPKETPEGPVFTVQGNMEPLSGLPIVMLLAASQGFIWIYINEVRDTDRVDTPDVPLLTRCQSRLKALGHQCMTHALESHRLCRSGRYTNWVNLKVKSLSCGIPRFRKDPGWPWKQIALDVGKVDAATDSQPSPAKVADCFERHRSIGSMSALLTCHDSNRFCGGSPGGFQVP